MLAGLGSAQCPNTARALAQTQGSTHYSQESLLCVCGLVNLLPSVRQLYYVWLIDRLLTDLDSE